MSNVYMLTHTYNEVPRATFVRSELSQDVFEKLVAFIEFKSADIDPNYSVDQEEVAEVLCRLYGAELLPNADYPNVFELNQYLNWEKYCGHALAIEKIEDFQRSELHGMLDGYIVRFFKTKNLCRCCERELDTRGECSICDGGQGHCEVCCNVVDCEHCKSL